MGSIHSDYNKSEEAYSTYEGNGTYTIKESPIGTLRPLKIITIGAGISGINMIRTLKLHTSNITNIVYEKNANIGGTWYENRYPGLRCDIPSHNYQFSHTPHLDWRNLFAEGSEIEEYLQHVCNVHDLRGVIKLSHRVVSARWEEERSQWVVSVRNEVSGEVFEDRGEFLLDASGILNTPKWPSIPGLDSFKGDLIHSANWPKDFDPKGKTIAVLGNGASGIQIVPALQTEVKKLIHIIRSPTWIIPPQRQMIAASPNAPFISSIGMDANENFTAEQIEEFKTDPKKRLKFIRTVEYELNSKFGMLINNSPEALMAQKMTTVFMSTLLNHDPELTKILIPSFPVGCRRVTPGITYLKALTQPNVQVTNKQIVEICADGFKFKDGEVVQVDAIVCATGFDVSFVPRYELRGERGENLQDRWKAEVPEAYMSCLVEGMPNYFTFLGPNAPIGHGSIPTITQHLATYILKFILKAQTENISSFRPLPAAVADYNEHISAFMPRTAWSYGGCGGWFKGGDDGTRNGEGDNKNKIREVTALHPGSRIHWFHMLENPRWEDFEWRCLGDVDGRGEKKKVNRFAYLGNGRSVKEGKDKSIEEQTWYWDQVDRL